MNTIVLVGAILFMLAILGYLGFLAWRSHRGTRKSEPKTLLGVYSPTDPEKNNDQENH